MFVVVQHAIKDPSIAFDRGRKLMVGEDAPPSTRVLQFLPSLDGSAVTCLWESSSVGSVEAYVDEVLGDSSDNVCYPVDAERAFAEAPTELAPSPAPSLV
jgi:hypothetical protein